MKGYYGQTLAFKKRVSSFVNSVFFDQFIILVVILNTISLGTKGLDPFYEQWTELANEWFTYIFIIEMILKLYVMGVREYTRDTMCLFDGLIVATSVMEIYNNQVNPPAATTTTIDGEEVAV